MLLSIKNNNPGNLVYVPSISWQGQIGKDPLSKFAQFDTKLNGVRANGMNAIAKFINHGATDLITFGEQWAPVSDNPGSIYGDYGNGLINYLNDNYPSILTTGSFNYVSNLSQLLEAIAHNEGALPNVEYFADSFSPGAMLALQAKGLI